MTPQETAETRKDLDHARQDYQRLVRERDLIESRIRNKENDMFLLSAKLNQKMSRK